jgi:hypothetical protein
MRRPAASAGPARYAAHGREGNWADDAERASGLGSAGQNAEGQQQAFGPKTEKRENFYFLFFFFSNISNAFSNSF